MKIRIMKSIPLLAAALLIAGGCNYFKKSQFHGKTFRIRTELKQGTGVEVLVWTNANRLERDKEGYGYTFYVNGKLVVLEPQGTVVIEEVQGDQAMIMKNDIDRERSRRMQLYSFLSKSSSAKEIQAELASGRVNKEKAREVLAALIPENLGALPPGAERENWEARGNDIAR